MSKQSRVPAWQFSALVALTATLVLSLPALTRAQGSKQIIRSTMPAVAMIMSVDIRDGQLVPVSSGSGTIVDANGSIITNHHVLYDAENHRLHDLFIVGLFRAADKEPELVCAGTPASGMLKADVDLALIRCDRDRDGNPMQPKSWPTIPIRKLDKEDIVPGEQVWVLGYPAVGGSTINVTAGLVSGWTGEEGGTDTRAFMKTDASITHGNSGGTAIDEDGNFIGVPTAFRLTTTTQGEAVVTDGRVGLIRPLDHALDLIARARAGGPVATPALATTTGEEAAGGVTVTGVVHDSAAGKAIEGATIIVFKAGIRAEDLEESKLEDQALSWGRTDAAGNFRMQIPIPRGQQYTVAVIADGFLPLVESGALVVAEDAADEFAPWDSIELQRDP